MDMLTHDDLRTLLGKRGGVCVSITMPAHEKGDQTRQDPIRLKNMLERAERTLEERGMRSPEARTILEPARRLLGDPDFWIHQSGGLAIFASRGETHVFRLPIHLNESVIVNDRFHVKPLFALFGSRGRFFVLAMSQRNVRVFDCTPFTAAQVAVPQLPQAIDELMQYVDAEKQMQFHTQSAPHMGRRDAVFHGGGAVAEDDSKDRLFEFFRQIDAALHPVLMATGAPLVFAGVDYLFPIYRRANTYPHLASQAIEGSPERLTGDDLRERAWPIVQEHFDAERRRHADRLEEALGKQHGSTRLEEILPAALNGRVDALFVDRGAAVWGRFDPNSGMVNVMDSLRPEGEDLLDAAAAQVFQHGGAVFALARDQMPADAPIAAIYRF